MIETIGAVLPAAAARFGDAAALVSGDRTFSFRELDEVSTHLAVGLRDLGVAAGDVVTLYSPNRWEWVVAYYAIAKAGAVVNPVNVLFTPSELEFVARDCGVKVIVTTADRAAALARPARRGRRVRDRRGRRADRLGGRGAVVRRCRRLGSSPGAVPLAASTATADDLSTICYTSGTTGRPKGAMQSHRAVLLNAAMTAQIHLRIEADVVVSALPCPHVYGTVVHQLGDDRAA